MDIVKLIVAEFPNVFCVNFIGLEPRGNCARNKQEVYIDLWSGFENSVPAIEYLASHGIDVGLYNFPLCAVDRKYWPLARKSIAGYKNCFAIECDQCLVKEKCAGLFTATLKFIKPIVFPVLDMRYYDKSL